MQHRIMRVLVMVLLSGAGCGQRDCEYVKNAKGDQVCSEDMQSAPVSESEPTRPEEPTWRDERNPSKDE